jgi:hypothetical protein
MTIFDLKAKLAMYPDDYKVVIDVSRDYREYDEVNDITPCEFGHGICGATVEIADKWNPNVNAVILT